MSSKNKCITLNILRSLGHSQWPQWYIFITFLSDGLAIMSGHCSATFLTIHNLIIMFSFDLVLWIFPYLTEGTKKGQLWKQPIIVPCTVCPQMSTVYNCLIFSNKKTSVSMDTEQHGHSELTGLYKYVKTIPSWHRKRCGHSQCCTTSQEQFPTTKG